MARYEGMEDLLQRVREHLEVEGDAAMSPSGPAGSSANLLTREQPYESALENLLLLLHDAEQLRERLTPGRLHALPKEQHDDLQSLLNKVLQELWSCEAALQRFSHLD